MMAELSTKLKDFMDNLDEVSSRLDKNPLIQNAKSSIEKDLNNTKISKEERLKLFSAYVQQMSMGVLGQAVEIVRDVPTAMANEEKAQYYKLQSLASLWKQFGFENIDLSQTESKDMLGTSSGEGMIDKQIDGFTKDMFYKLGNMISNENQMLVQNDQAVKPWQVDTLKMVYEAMTNGKINLKTVNDETIAEWKADATTPNGIVE